MLPTVYIAVTIFGLIIIPYPCPVKEHDVAKYYFHSVKISVE